MSPLLNKYCSWPKWPQGQALHVLQPTQGAPILRFQTSALSSCPFLSPPLECFGLFLTHKLNYILFSHIWTLRLATINAQRQNVVAFIFQTSRLVVGTSLQERKLTTNSTWILTSKFCGWWDPTCRDIVIAGLQQQEYHPYMLNSHVLQFL